MKLYSRLIIIVLSALMATSCENEESRDHVVSGGNEIVLGMSIGDEPTRASISLVDGTFDMNIRWQEGDIVNIMVLQDDVYQSCGQSEIYGISSNGKSCSMRVSLPADVDKDKKYTIFCMTEVDMSVSNQKMHCSTNLSRSPMNAFMVRLFAAKTMEPNDDRTVKFHHFGTYEVLHVVNTSSEPITFAHCGFAVQKKWYYTKVDYVYNIDEYSLENKDTQADAVSDEITIPAGSSASFVSWYMPTGDKLLNANLLAKINGEDIKSATTLSSKANITLGKAYHMYAEWDGSLLKFVRDVDVVDYDFSLDDMPGEDWELEDEDTLHLCPDSHHPHMIDMGGKSKVLWACCNIGATKPEEVGGYYAWGETHTKDVYTDETYSLFIKTENRYEDIGSNISGTEYDVAHVKWGDGWRIPTHDEQYGDLLSDVIYQTIVYNGTKGRLLIAKNGNKLFFPFGGQIIGTKLCDFGEDGLYWLSIRGSNSYYYYPVDEKHIYQSGTTPSPSFGCNIRAVCNKEGGMPIANEPPVGDGNDGDVIPD